MELAIWNSPAAEFLLSGQESGAMHIPVYAKRGTPEECLTWLSAGLVDVAMVSALEAYRRSEELSILSGVALSTWNNPYARLLLRKGLSQVNTIAYNPTHELEALIARIILKEHYALEPEFQAQPGAAPTALLSSNTEACVLVGDNIPLIHSEALLLDIGQEWYELSNYPMVWGFWAARKDEATPEMIERLVALRQAAEAYRSKWLQANDMPPVIHHFYADDLRLSFDDLAIASLTEWSQYLYYYGITEEVKDLVVYQIPTGEAEEDDE